MKTTKLNRLLACLGFAGAVTLASITRGADGSPGDLKRLEAERIEWFKARTEQLLKETGLSREQLAKYHSLSVEDRGNMKLTERQAGQIRAYQIEVVTHYEAWLKASGRKQLEAPPRRRQPGHFQDRPLQSLPGSA